MQENKIQKVLDLDLEIYSIEKILNLKKARLRELQKSLDAEEFYKYNEQKLKLKLDENLTQKLDEKLSVAKP